MAKASVTEVGSNAGVSKTSNAKNAERRISAKEAKEGVGVNTMKEAMQGAELTAGSIEADSQEEIEMEVGHSTKDAMMDRMPELAKTAESAENASAVGDTEDAETETVEEKNMKDETVKSEAKDGETTEKKITLEKTEATTEELVTEEQKDEWRWMMRFYGVERTLFANDWFDARYKGVLADQDELDPEEYAGVLLAQTEYFWRHYCNCGVNYKILGGGESYMSITSRTENVRGAGVYKFTLEDVDDIHCAIDDLMKRSPALRERIRRDVTGGSKQWRRECGRESAEAPFAIGTSYLYWYFALQDLQNRGYEVADELDEYGLLAVRLPLALRRLDRQQPMMMPMLVSGLHTLAAWCSYQEQKVENEANEAVLVQIFMKLAGVFNDEDDYGLVGRKFKNQMIDEDGQFMVQMYDLSLEGLRSFVDEVCTMGQAAAVLAAKALRFELAKAGWNWLNEQELLEKRAKLKKAEDNKVGSQVRMGKSGLLQCTSEEYDAALLALNSQKLDFGLADDTIRSYNVDESVELVMDIANELMR